MEAMSMGKARILNKATPAELEVKTEWDGGTTWHLIFLAVVMLAANLSPSAIRNRTENEATAREA